jgi:FKBP-type peptidyl-prolyl cis-trans isomerase SlyD
MLHIEKNNVVSIRYIMKNSNGVILENTMNNDPVSYLHGSTGILPLLQAQLEGLKTGNKKLVYLTAASGLTNEDFIFEVIVDEVRAASGEEILLGYPVKVNVAKCEADCDCYNYQEEI